MQFNVLFYKFAHMDVKAKKKQIDFEKVKNLNKSKKKAVEDGKKVRK